MKKHRLLKLISLIFVCTILVGVVALSALAAGNEQDPVVEIAKKNIYFGDKLQLMFAIDAPASVEVTATANGKNIGIDYIENQTIGGKEYRVYKTVEGWAAQNINTVVTVSATAGNKTDKLTYSVLEYLYERINVDTNVPQNKLKMYNSLLQYAIDADQVINNTQDRTPNELDKYYYVTLENATFDGYNTCGMFKLGDTPFANVDHTLDLGEEDVLEWSYSLNGGKKTVINETELKTLTVNGTLTVSAGIYVEPKVESFLYFTDPHYIASGSTATWKSHADTHFAAMKSVYDSRGLNFALCGGDWLNDSNTKSSALQIMAEIKQKMVNNFGTAYLMIGNHDYNYQTIVNGSTVQSEHELTPEEITSVWFSEYGKTYYSFQSETTTFYVLDSGKDWDHARLTEHDKAQIKWYLESLKSTDDKHIAITPHMLCVNDVTWMIHPATDKIAEISNVYNNRGQYTFDGVTYDFSAKTGRVEFILAGHTHADSVGTLHDIPYIVTYASHLPSAADGPSYDIVTIDYENRVISTERMGTGSDRTIYLDPCTDNHYATNADGHKATESCAKCGITAQSSYTAHTEPKVKTVFENASKRYDYVCEECGYVLFSRTGDFGTDINYFSAPGQTYVRWEGGKPFEIIKEGNQIFTRAHLTHAYGSFCVSNREGLVEKAYTAEWDKIQNGSGKYAVFKLRAYNVSTLTFGLQSNGALTDFPDSAFVSRYDNGGFNNWKVYVVDLSKMAPPAYSVDDESVTNVVYGFRAAAAVANNSYIDLEYFAICDTWEQIASVVGNETVCYTDWRNPANDSTISSSGDCTGEHSIKLSVSGSKYTYTCEHCTFQFERTVSVGANGVNFYSAAGQQYNNFRASPYDSAQDGISGTLKYDSKGGFVYNSSQLGVSGSFAFGSTTSAPTDLLNLTSKVYGTGQYFVIKIRVTEGIGQMKIGAYDGTTGSSTVTADKMCDNNIRHQLATDWTVFVIEASALNTYYTTGSSGETMASFGFKAMNDGTGTVDVAYFAVCGDWNEIATVVGDDKVVYTNWKTTDIDTVLTGSGACTGDHMFTLKTDGSKYTYTCKFCDFTEERTVEVGTNGINFYSAPGQQYNNYNVPAGSSSRVNGPTGILRYDEDGGFVYNRMEFADSGSMIFLGTGSTVPSSNAILTNTANTVYGTGKYIVIKMRADAITTQMKIGAYDAAHSSASGDNIYEANVRDIVATEWTVFVIDIEQMMASGTKFYTPGNTATTTASFGYKVANQNSVRPTTAGTVDVAYFAVCDNWNEVATVVGTNETVYLTAWDGTSAATAVNVSDMVD